MVNRPVAAAVGTMIVLMSITSAVSAKGCGTVRFGQVNWTGVSAKTETAAWMLDQIGYKTDVITASLPIVLQSLANDDRDFFLGWWLPSQRDLAIEHMKERTVNLVTKNLSNAKYTIGVNRAAWESGVRHMRDLREHAEEFDNTIFGIEAGSGGNNIINTMIQDDVYGLSDWELQPSSEAGMLSEVGRRIERNEWVAWLAWAPHPMVLNIDLEFLEGGQDYWGPNQGGATVYSLSSAAKAWKCPNVGQFIENFWFTVEEQSRMAGYIINEDMGYAEAGKKLIAEKPSLLERWLGNGGTYQTGPIMTQAGDGTALDVIERALKHQVSE